MAIERHIPNCPEPPAFNRICDALGIDDNVRDELRTERSVA